MKPDLLPAPKRAAYSRGQYTPAAGVNAAEPAVAPAARFIAERLRLPLQAGAGAADIRVSLAKRLNLPRAVRPEQRLEAYQLQVGSAGVALKALTPEGLLRGAATLFQLARRERGRWVLPSAAITDWPNFRFRCASDWLINVECNRWAYDWGDGRAAFVKRIERKLDFCFEHKINMVLFDGFGWDTNRFRGYAALMRQCNAYARRRGIRLFFGGYGGGYGTSYQAGEIYRYGYFGKVFFNRRPYPNGRIYTCCGGNVSGRYGTCQSNAGLKADKLAEIKRFVTEVNPGLMYIHDLDAAGWLPVRDTWLNRCPACRRRWPNDKLAAPDGHAGAYAAWFRQVRRELSALPACGDYVPARDLTLAFTSPLYTHYDERKPDNVWDLEQGYFTLLSRLIGPETGIEFGLREQFYDAKNRKKIASLRKSLDAVGHGHGLHVIAFGGGDNYISDDLANISGTMAHFYDGAESVCLSNGGVHEDPVQLLNADCLWSGSAGGYRETPANEAEAESVFEAIAEGKPRPPAIFGPGRYFDRLCARRWGPQAGRWMSRALTARRNGQFPVSRVWWAVTKPVIALKNNAPFSLQSAERQWADRGQATAQALAAARRAARLSADEDVRWLVRCLDVGGRYAEAVRCLVRLAAATDPKARPRLSRLLDNLAAYIRGHFDLKKTDILGGDPGCWLETVAEMRKVSRAIAKRRAGGLVCGDFLVNWQVSRAQRGAGKLGGLRYPERPQALGFRACAFTAAFCNAHDDLTAGGPGDALLYFKNRFACAQSGPIELRIGYDGPVKVWLDGRELFHDPNGTNPGKIDSAIIRRKAAKGEHELMIALGSNGGKAYGVYARFGRRRAAVGAAPLPVWGVS